MMIEEIRLPIYQWFMLSFIVFFGSLTLIKWLIKKIKNYYKLKLGE